MVIQFIAIISLFFLPDTLFAEKPLCLSCHSYHYVNLGRCTNCHLGNPSSERKNIAHTGVISGRYAKFTIQKSETDEGLRLILKYACRRCHTTAGEGNILSVNLDNAAFNFPPEHFAESIRKPVHNMPDFHISEDGITALLNALLDSSVKFKNRSRTSEIPNIVHFDKAISGVERDVFSIKCGACHRILSKSSGALGSGSIGPNLSGLLSPFYPKSYKGGTQWSEEKLFKWLKNPRAIRERSIMRPVIISDSEFMGLMQTVY